MLGATGRPSYQRRILDDPDELAAVQRLIAECAPTTEPERSEFMRELLKTLETPKDEDEHATPLK